MMQKKNFILNNCLSFHNTNKTTHYSVAYVTDAVALLRVRACYEYTNRDSIAR